MSFAQRRSARSQKLEEQRLKAEEEEKQKKVEKEALKAKAKLEKKLREEKVKNGFLLWRLKCYKGEGIDIGCPTDDDLYGSKAINSGEFEGVDENWFKHNNVDYTLGELTMIVYGGGYDDKTDKRIKRMIFLTTINNNQNLKKLYINLSKFLNGQEGDEKVPYKINDISSNVIIYTTGGNLITLFACILKTIISFNDNYAHLRIFKRVLDQLGLLESNDWVDLYKAVINLKKDEDIINELSGKSPSDLDYKMIPIIGRTTFSQVSDEITFLKTHLNKYINDIELHQLMQDNGCNIDKNSGDNNPDNPLLNDMYKIWKTKSESEPYSLLDRLKTAEDDCPSKQVPPGPKTSHIFTQIASEDLANQFTDHKDKAYIDYLLKNKNAITLNTEINSLCMISACGIDKIFPFLSFMITINYISKFLNYYINSQINNSLSKPLERNDFKNIASLKESGIVDCLTYPLEKITKDKIWISFTKKVDRLVKYIGILFKKLNHGTWVANELKKYVPTINDVMYSFNNNTRFTINAIYIEQLYTTTQIEKLTNEITEAGNSLIKIKNQEEFNHIVSNEVRSVVSEYSEMLLVKSSGSIDDSPDYDIAEILSTISEEKKSDKLNQLLLTAFDLKPNLAGEGEEEEDEAKKEAVNEPPTEAEILLELSNAFTPD